MNDINVEDSTAEAIRKLEAEADDFALRAEQASSFAKCVQWRNEETARRQKAAQLRESLA